MGRKTEFTKNIAGSTQGVEGFFVKIDRHFAPDDDVDKPVFGILFQQQGFFRKPYDFHFVDQSSQKRFAHELEVPLLLQQIVDLFRFGNFVFLNHVPPMIF